MIHESVKLKMKQLKLSSCLDELDVLLREATDSTMSYPDFLNCLFEAELKGREVKRIARRLRQAQFPISKSLSDFDFSKRETVNKHQITSFCTGSFVDDKENIIFIGQPGLGKTHLAISIAHELCHKDYSVWFTTATSLVNKLREARDEKQLNRYFAMAQKLDLVVIDEMGYFPFEKDASELLFQYISERYERKSMMITTNLPFSKWNEIFYTERLTTAVLDRLVHHSTILEFSGESYRFNQALEKKSRNKSKKEKEESA
jgi:DNA replication protein DnaC